MQVMRAHGKLDLRLHEEPMPEPGSGEALVRVTTVGICGSDVHWYTEGAIGTLALSRPLVLGHEFAGVVESGSLRGERVAVDPAIPCEHCQHCRAGNPNFCQHLVFAGTDPHDGALRGYVAWPERCLFPLPDSISDEEGAMLEPLGVAIHSVDLAHIRPGMTVGVFGCGPIGLLIVQVARLAGAARIVATDLPTLPHRLQAARALGATAFPADGGREVIEIDQWSGGHGLDVVFEAAGDGAALEACIAAAAPGGKVIWVGIPADDRTAFSASQARRKGLTIKLVRRMKNTYERAISLTERRMVDLACLVTHRYPLIEAAVGFEVAARREGLRALVLCS